MRVVRVGLLVALALAVSGCGSKKQASASSGAAIVSATAPVFVSIDSNLNSSQWKQVDKLLRKFPISKQLIAQLRSSLKEGSGLDYERDVKPALGDEIDLVWLDFENGGTNVVAVTKPKDADAFKRMIEKGNKNPDQTVVSEEKDGWFVISNTQQKLDRFRQEAESGKKLSGDALFKDALAELPDDALVHIFVRGKSIVEGLRGLSGLTPLQLGADQRPEFLSAALTAEGSGFRLVGAGRAEKAPKTQIEPFKSKLLGDVPADAVAFLTFRGGKAFEQQLSELEKDPTYKQGIQELQRMLGVRLDSLLSLFTNEVGLYVRPGSPIPEVTLLLEAPDEKEALARVDKAIAALTHVMTAQPCHDGTRCVEIEGVEVRTAAFDNKVVVTTGQGAISKLRGSGPRLGDDEGFKSARDAAALPDESTGFMWIDLQDGIPMILGLASASGTSIPAEIRVNLEPLGSFLAWAKNDGRTGSFTAFLQID